MYFINIKNVLYAPPKELDIHKYIQTTSFTYMDQNVYLIQTWVLKFESTPPTRFNDKHAGFAGRFVEATAALPSKKAKINEDRRLLRPFLGRSR